MSFKNCIRIRITSFWRLAYFATLPLFCEQAFSSRWYCLNALGQLKCIHMKYIKYSINSLINFTLCKNIQKIIYFATFFSKKCSKFGSLRVPCRSEWVIYWLRIIVFLTNCKFLSFDFTRNFCDSRVFLILSQQILYIVHLYI